MRARKYLIIIAILLLVVLVVPFFITLNSFKGQIIQGFQQATGREMKIEGNIRFAVLPMPEINITKIEIPSLKDAQDRNFIELQKVSAKISILQLLQGKISFSRIEVDSPVFNIESFKDGRQSWELKKVKNSDTEDSKSNTMVLPFSSLGIYNAKINYRKDKELNSVNHLNTEISVNEKLINFKGDLKVKDLPISVKGTIGKIADIMPLDVEVRVFGENLKISGDVNTEVGAFNGKAALNGKLSDLLPNVPKELQNQMKLTSNLIASSSGIKLDELNVTVGEIKGQGQAKFDTDKNTAKLNFAIQPGDVVISLASDNIKSTDAGKITLTAKNLKQFLKALGVETKDMPDFIEKEFSFATSASYADGIVNMQKINFNAGAASLNGNVLIKSKGAMQEYEYEISTDDANSLARLFGSESFVRRVRVAGTSKYDGNKIQTDTKIYAAWSETGVSGLVDLNASKNTSLKITTAGEDFSRTWAELFKSDLFSGAKNYRFNFDIIGELANTINLTIKDSKINMDGGNVSIGGTYTSSQNSAKADFDISANTIKLGANSSGSSRDWSQEKIDLSGLNKLKGTLTVNIKKLVKNNMIFDNVKARVTANNGLVNIENLSAILGGGILEANGSLSSKDAQPLTLSAKIRNAQLSNLLPSKTYKITQGTMNLDVDLRSFGKSQLAYIQNLSGKIGLVVGNGKISGFDLYKAKEAISNVKSLESLLNVLDGSFSGGETAYKSVVGKIDIEKGIAYVKEFNIDAADAKAVATGTINLPAYNLDISTDVDVMLKNIPTFKVKIYGSLDNPSHKLDTKSLQQYIMQNILTGALQGGLKKLNIPGAGAGEGSKPQDLIGGIITGLTKKKN